MWLIIVASSEAGLNPNVTRLSYRQCDNPTFYVSRACTSFPPLLFPTDWPPPRALRWAGDPRKCTYYCGNPSHFLRMKLEPSSYCTSSSDAIIWSYYLGDQVSRFPGDFFTVYLWNWLANENKLSDNNIPWQSEKLKDQELIVRRIFNFTQKSTCLEW